MDFKYFFLLICVAFSCSKPAKKNITAALDENHVLNNTLSHKIDSSFLHHGINGCFILHDLKRDTSIIYNKSRVGQAFLPASTFKILNSLIGLECGAIRDIDEVIPWDGIDRPIPSWNRDHTMRSAIKFSVVWFYQELARRIGEGQMQKWVDSVGYGNHNIGKEIDDFWLVGDLRITPMEQITFLKKLILEELPFKKANILAVREILIEDQNDQYVFRAKTGWADFGQGIGWYVGYIEIRDDTFIFVNNVDINKNEDARARKSIVKEILDYAFQIDLNI